MPRRSAGVFDTYTETNLRYSQLAPLSMFEEKNTGNNLPAQIELYTKPGDSYEFLFMAKGADQPTSRSCSRRPRRCSTSARWSTSSTSHCERSAPGLPAALSALVVGGTSAEYALKTAKYASAHYSTTCRPRATQRPVTGTATSRGTEDP